MNLSREFKTGVIAIGGILLLILGYTYLKSDPLFASSKVFYAEFKNVGGLLPGTQVSMNGLNVGKVGNITFKDNRGTLVVKVIFNEKIDFSRNSKIQLYSSSPLGGKGIQIVQVFDDAPMAKSGDTLPSAVYGGLMEQIEPSLMQVRGAFSSADSTLNNLNRLLDDQTRYHIQESAANFDAGMKDFKLAASRLSGMLADNQEDLEASISNVRTITDNLAMLSDSLNNAGLTGTVQELQESLDRLNGILVRVEQGEGSLGKLTQDEELYDNLNSASRELELLLQDFRLNPKRYVNVSVFGKKQKEYVFPQDDPAKNDDPQKDKD